MGTRPAIQRPVSILPISIGRWWWWVTVSSLLSLQRSSQLRSTHPLHAVLDTVNESGPFIGLVVAYPPEAEAVRSSGVFVPRSDVPWVDLYGRRFHIGSIRNVDVVYVMSGQRRLNAGITVQILLDLFDVRGIVHYGTAGSANDSLSFGDVSVPKFVAFTGAWTWTVEFVAATPTVLVRADRGPLYLRGKLPESLCNGAALCASELAILRALDPKFDSEKEEAPELRFGAYNFPTQGKNLLSRVDFKPEELYLVDRPMEEVFWLQMNPEWFQVAERLKDMDLQRCINETYCLPETPKVVFGLKASTADLFLANAAYRKFLFKEFGVSTVDEESAAVMMTAMSPGVPVVVFRGVSDLAGGEGAKWSSTALTTLACTNALKVAVEFIGAIGKQKLLLPK